MAKLKGHAKRLADLVERPVKELDPEADVVPDDSDENSSADESADEKAGREHYVSVGKSKLRGLDPATLGPQYRGTRVSRADLEAEDDDDEEDEDDEEEEDDASEDASSAYEDALEKFDDPDTADLEADQEGQEDISINSEEAFGEGDEEKFKDFVFNGTSNFLPKKSKHAKRPTAADFMASEDEADFEDDMDPEMEGSDNDVSDDFSDLGESLEDSDIGGFIDDEAEESDDGESGSDDGEDEDSDEDSDEGSDDESAEDDEDGKKEKKKGSDKKSKLTNGSGIVASIKELALGEKAIVQSLTKTMDSDVQKGKVVQRQRKTFDALLNIRIRLQKSLVAVNSLKYADQSEDETTEPYEAAERSALQLWNALDDFRTSISKGKKRKVIDTDDISTAALWGRMELHEKRQVARRKQVLEKWSRDAKKTSITMSSGHKFSSNAEKPITAVLSAELDAPERLIKRTRTPRSCAPYQVAKKVNEDESIYDDADFYQLLLKELVDQRSGDGSGAGLQAATIRYAAVKEAKAKRHVDTKASKGRKMRFTVMPKLQNFMAPEDRRGWEQGAIDRFFGTLFGQKLVLDEESSDEEMGGVTVEDDGLRLFKS